MAHLIAILLAVIIDRIVGDPRSLPHPVVGIGKLITVCDRYLNKGEAKRAKGLLMLIFICTFVFLVTICIVLLSYRIHLYIGIAVEAWIISTTIAARGLMQAAEEVAVPLRKGNFSESRKKLSYIVGRDTETLNEEEITRATVETVAENTSDGVTAPLFFALIGGAPLAMLYRAVNTCDSMVGYKNNTYKEFGWASAKFDDLLNWVPSRLTAAVMILSIRAMGDRTKQQCWEIVRRDARKHPSPNSGWTEAAMAALMAVQLGGVNTYKGVVSNRAKMGNDERALKVNDIEVANKIMLKTVNQFTLFILLVGGAIYAIT
ncbi:adenosylcobinamide-phosphate synthase CbiB [Halalkalibacter krulwichiae]|nr:adenosylcobinamide-phosphate synthase CbiB [Halalkalibacter krulwichiae]